MDRGKWIGGICSEMLESDDDVMGYLIPFIRLKKVSNLKIVVTLHLYHGNPDHYKSCYFLSKLIIVRSEKYCALTV